MNTQTSNVPAVIAIHSTTIADESIPTVSARDLHTELTIGRDFSSWIKDQIDRAMLQEGQDFVKLTKKGELSKTGQWTTEYHLTLDSAKQICMMSQTIKGLAVRKYFIEVEKQYRQKPTAEDPMLIMAKAIQYADTRIKELEPKARTYDNFLDRGDNVPLTLAAKTFGLSAVKLSDALLGIGFFESHLSSSGARRRPTPIFSECCVLGGIGKRLVYFNKAGMAELEKLFGDGGMISRWGKF